MKMVRYPLRVLHPRILVMLGAWGKYWRNGSTTSSRQDNTIDQHKVILLIAQYMLGVNAGQVLLGRTEFAA